MKGIYRLHVDCGRMGNLEGLFLADSQDVENLMGRHVYFGEVLGKHSEIYGNIDEKDVSLVTNDVTAVEVFEKYDLSSGFNPFDYVESGDDEEIEKED